MLPLPLDMTIYGTGGPSALMGASIPGVFNTSIPFSFHPALL
jgi:hypothetical protein